MTLRRIRVGESAALAGALLVIAALLRPWYQTPSGNVGAWDTFGPAVVLIIAALISALAIVAGALAEHGTALPVATAVWTCVLGLVGLIAAIVRVLERPQHASALCVGAWLALGGTALIALAGWLVLRDERPSMYPPASVDARPAP
jgi:hypothetical protein